MSVTVKIPAPLRPSVGGNALVECEPGTVRELIDQIERAHAGFADRVSDGERLRRFVNVFIDGEDVRFSDGMETPARDGAQVTILPAVAGG